MSKLKIGYENFLNYVDSYVFTAGSEDADNPLANSYDNKLFDHMALAASVSAYQIDVTLDQAREADYIAIYKHNLHDVGGTIQLYSRQEIVDNLALETGDLLLTESSDILTTEVISTSYVASCSLISPSDSKPIMILFDSAISNNWRIEIDNNNQDCTIADLRFGKSLTTEQGLYMIFSSPIFARKVEYIDNMSDSGLFLGRSVKRSGAEVNCNFEFMSDAWMRTYWSDFLDHAELKPFYLAWNYTDYPTEVMFCQTNGPIPAASHSNYGYQSQNLPLIGFIK